MSLSLGIGLGLPMQRGGDSEFSPLDLFADGQKGGIYIPNDLTRMWQDASRLVPVTADGQIVRIMDDPSGNSFDLSALVGETPLYKTDGTSHWLQFDGTDDRLGHTHGLSIDDFLIGIAFRETTRQNAWLYSGGTDADSTDIIRAATPFLDGNYYIDTVDIATGRVTGVWPNSVDDDSVLIHDRTGSAVSVELDGSPLDSVTSAGTISGDTLIRLGARKEGVALHFAGRVYGFVVVYGAYSSENKTKLANYLAALS